MFTGLLGNLLLLSYFAKKRETEVVVVQTLGVISIYVVIAQLAMAEAMPLPHFFITSFVVASGLVLNFLYYFELLNLGIWRFGKISLPLLGSLHFPKLDWANSQKNASNLLDQYLDGLPHFSLCGCLLHKWFIGYLMLLAMIGNGLMIPRALFIRDFMWFIGSSWASVFYGWGNLSCLYC